MVQATSMFGVDQIHAKETLYETELWLFGFLLLQMKND